MLVKEAPAADVARGVEIRAQSRCREAPVRRTTTRPAHASRPTQRYGTCSGRLEKEAKACSAFTPGVASPARRSAAALNNRPWRWQWCTSPSSAHAITSTRGNAWPYCEAGCVCSALHQMIIREIGSTCIGACKRLGARCSIGAAFLRCGLGKLRRRPDSAEVRPHRADRR